MNRQLLISISLSLTIHILILGLLKLSAGNAELAHQKPKNIAFSISLKAMTTEVLNDIPVGSGQETISIAPINNASPSQGSSLRSYLPPDQRYYAVKELDHPPVMKGDIDTQPAELAQFEQGGEIKIQLWIDEKGNVVQSEILDSNLPQPYMDYTITEFKQAKFVPGIKKGVPVKTLAKIVVQFAPNNW